MLQQTFPLCWPNLYSLLGPLDTCCPTPGSSQTHPKSNPSLFPTLPVKWPSLTHHWYLLFVSLRPFSTDRQGACLQYNSHWNNSIVESNLLSTTNPLEFSSFSSCDHQTSSDRVNHTTSFWKGSCLWAFPAQSSPRVYSTVPPPLVLDLLFMEQFSRHCAEPSFLIFYFIPVHLIVSVSTQVSHPHRQSTNEHAYQTSAEAGVCENCPPEVSSGMSQRYPNISKPRQALVPHDLSYDWCPCHPIRQAGHQSLMFSASTINKAWHCHLINFSQTQLLGSNPNTSTLVKKLLVYPSCTTSNWLLFKFTPLNPHNSLFTLQPGLCFQKVNVTRSILTLKYSVTCHFY